MNFQPFHLVLEQADATTELRVRQALLVLEQLRPSGRSVVQNLLEEAHLTFDDWQLLMAQLSKAELTPATLASAVQQFCSTARRSPKPWGPIAKPCTDVLGRFIKLDNFVSCLLEAGFFDDEADARAAIRQLLDRPIDELPMAARAWPLGRFIIWSTFRVDDSARESVLSRPPGDISAIFRRLGLERPMIGTPVLMLEYRLPNGLHAHLPTFFEAYAGSVWNQWFRCPSKGAPWGRTFAGSIAEDSEPEVVHAVLEASQLAAPITEA